MDEAILVAVRKAFGNDIVFLLNEPGRVPNVIFRSTGIATLDVALDGGIPEGRIIEVYGPESAGKTALVCGIMGSLQQQGFTGVYIDMEYAFNPKEATENGLDLDKVYFSQPEDARTAMGLIEQLCRKSTEPLAIVLDSVAALVTPAELEADPGSAQIGETARLMSQMMRKLKGPVSTGRHILIFTNQLRMKIGQMFGNPETTTGGRALRFYASQRLQLLGRQKLGPKDNPTGLRTRVRVDKNKVGRPFQMAEFDILFDGTGIDKMASVLDASTSLEIVRKVGGNHYFPFKEEKRFAASRDDAVQYLKDHPEFFISIYKELSKLFPSAPVNETEEV